MKKTKHGVINGDDVPTMTAESAKEIWKSCPNSRLITGVYSTHHSIGIDPFDRLNWFQRILKKTGLFYRNRPISGGSIITTRKDGSVEFKAF